MNKYLATVRIKTQLVKTIVFADSEIHARLILQYQYGFDSVSSNPIIVNEVGTAKPPTPQQERITNLKQQLKSANLQNKQTKLNQRQTKLNKQRNELASL